MCQDRLEYAAVINISKFLRAEHNTGLLVPYASCSSQDFNPYSGTDADSPSSVMLLGAMTGGRKMENHTSAP